MLQLSKVDLTFQAPGCCQEMCWKDKITSHFGLIWFTILFIFFGGSLIFELFRGELHLPYLKAIFFFGVIRDLSHMKILKGTKGQ